MLVENVGQSTLMFDMPMQNVVFWYIKALKIHLKNLFETVVQGL